MHRAVSQGLLRLARSRWSRIFLGWVMSHMSFAIPLERLRDTETLMAFHHPHPSHAVHILLVPKRPFSSLMDVPLEASDFLRDLLETVQILIRQYGLEEKGYRLVVNGGDYQEVPHLHFHLVADQE
jgi:histidine triad (HIT) family protein